MTPEETELALDDQWRKPRRWPWGVGAVSLVAVILAVYLSRSPAQATAKAEQLLEEGYAALWLDSHDQFVVADRAIQAALVESPTAAPTLAAFAELELRWAEALRDGRAANLAPPEYDEHLRRGEAVVRKAERAEPELRATRRALAQWYRMQTPPQAAAAAALFAEEPEPLHVTVHYELGKTAMTPPVDPERATSHLERAVELEPRMLRARFELARAYLTLPQPDEARAIAQLDALLSVNPHHRRAAALRASLEADAEGESDGESEGELDGESGGESEGELEGESGGESDAEPKSDPESAPGPESTPDR